MGFAFFDLDQTLVPFDTQALFCNFILRRERLRTAYLAAFAPCVPLAGLKLIRSRELKRAFLTYLWRMPQNRLSNHVHDFVREAVLPIVYREVRAEIERHLSEGRTTILNTASPDIYAGQIAAALGFHHCIATKVDLSNQDRVPLWPRIIGPNNKHAAKLPAMRHLLPDGALDSGQPIPDSWAYSDSIADKPMLELSEHPVLINPDPQLAALGQARGWTVRAPARPFRGQWGFRLACARQALGLYQHG